jgi:formate dehydrogenase (coenzyme F420) beta subunit
MTAQTTERLRDVARKWLADGDVDVFVGFRKREDGSAVPVRVRDAAEVDRLVFDDDCVHNLMSYIDLAGDEMVGVLLKGCDGRALVQLVAEGELDRDRVKVLGVVCPGLTTSTAGGGGDRELHVKCRTCRVNTPPVYDELIEGEAEQWNREADLAEIEEIEALTHGERAEEFKHEFDRCIRCYACRDICPLCYCEECVTEKTRPQWVEVSIKPSSNLYWHLIRAYHLAGRCVECGECDRACPVDIPLRRLNRKMAADVERLFGYRSGMDPDATPALQEFKEDEEHVLCPGGDA